MPGVTEHLARALLEAHGENAVAFAEQALRNVLHLGMTARVREWEQVIETIKTLRTESR